jgi:hypothetical protein
MTDASSSSPSRIMVWGSDASFVANFFNKIKADLSRI